MTNELTIRTADLADAEALADLMTQLGYPTSQKEMSDRLAAIFPDPDYVTFGHCEEQPSEALEDELEELAQGFVAGHPASTGRWYAGR